MSEHQLLHRLMAMWVQLRERLRDQRGYTTETVAMTAALATLAIAVVAALSLIVLRVVNGITV